MLGCVCERESLYVLEEIQCVCERERTGEESPRVNHDNDRKTSATNELSNDFLNQITSFK